MPLRKSPWGPPKSVRPPKAAPSAPRPAPQPSRAGLQDQLSATSTAGVDACTKSARSTSTDRETTLDLILLPHSAQGNHRLGSALSTGHRLRSALPRLAIAV